MLATRNFFKRNRTNFAVGAGIIGGAYVATQYVLGKLTEARENMATDRIAKENLRRRFEQNQEDCSFTVLALLPTATERILDVLPVEQITHQLQEKKAARLARSTAPSEASVGAKDDDGLSVKSSFSEAASQFGPDGEKLPKKSKAQLWNELKLTSITRAYTLIYTLALLTFLTRIQLNLLGRKNYLSSVVSLAAPSSHSSDSASSFISMENNADPSAPISGAEFDINRKYLTFSWWLLHRGWRKLLTVVEVAVKQVFGPLNPRDDISMAQLHDLTMQIRRTIEGDEDFATSWLPFLLPPHGEEDLVLSEAGVIAPPSPSAGPDTPGTFASSAVLRRLLDETSDLIDSPPGRSVVSQMLDAGFSVLLDEKLAEQAFKIVGGPVVQELDEDGRDDEGRMVNLTVTTKVANVLAVMTRQAHLIGNGVPNEYLKAMERQRDLTGFSAIIYSNFDLAKPANF